EPRVGRGRGPRPRRRGTGVAAGDPALPSGPCPGFGFVRTSELGSLGAMGVGRCNSTQTSIGFVSSRRVRWPVARRKRLPRVPLARFRETRLGSFGNLPKIPLASFRHDDLRSRGAGCGTDFEYPAGIKVVVIA